MTPWVLRLIIANVAMFLLTSASPAIMEKLMLVPALADHRPWTIMTYMFLHAGFGHIFFNMLALFFFGPRLEAELGGKSFLWLYFISGISGAILSFFFTPHTAIVGASGAIYGVMLGFAYCWPRERIYIWGAIPVESRYLVAGMAILSVVGGFGVSSDGTAHFAHLGGFVGGFLYLKFRSTRKPVAQYIEEVVASFPSSDDMKRWSGIDRMKLHEVNRAEFDRIQEKMNAPGTRSLTPEERAFLDRFSSV